MLSEIKRIQAYRKKALRQMQELQADFEDFTDNQLIEHRKVMAGRIDACLELLGENDEENIEEGFGENH